MDKISIQVMRLPGRPEDIPLPAKQTSGSAGFDVFAACPGPLTLAPGGRQAVPTGLALAIPEGFEVQVRPRSGLALKHGIVLPNSPGTIDSDYRGELKIIMMNLGEAPFEVKAGDRIAQLVVSRVADAEWDEVENLDDTERAGGGFGHTGV